MNPQSTRAPMDALTNQRLGPRSLEAFARAQRVFPDGTSRVTIERDPTPRYMSHGEGAYLVDLDGRRFLDLNANFTTLIHGHAFPPVVEALERQLRSGACFANPTEPEIALASLICERVPRLDRIRFVNTGTEAVMFAIKAARAFTGRSAVAKIEGAFHGSYDCAEVSQASTPADWGDPNAPASTAYYRGAPVSLLDEVVVLRFNDAEGARRRLTERAKDLAAIILDPMPSRAGLIAPEPAFLEAVRETAKRPRHSGDQRRGSQLPTRLSRRCASLRPRVRSVCVGEDHRRRLADRRGRRPRGGDGCLRRRCGKAPGAAGRHVFRQSPLDGRWPCGDAGPSMHQPLPGSTGWAMPCAPRSTPQSPRMMRRSA